MAQSTILRKFKKLNTKIESFSFKNSSNILRIDFDNLTETMLVYFRNGTCYQYVNVPYKLFEEFKISESAGKFFLSEVKDKFEFLKKNF